MSSVTLKFLRLAHDQIGNLFFGHLILVVFGHLPSLGQDHEPVGHLEDVMQIVGDEDDAHPILSRGANVAEHLSCLADRKSGRGFIQNQDLAAEVDGSADGDRLPFAPRQRDDRLVRVPNVDADVRERLRGLRAHPRVVEHADGTHEPGQFSPEVKVSGNAHSGDEREILIQGFDTECARILWGIEPDWAALEQDSARRGPVGAREDLDERGFTRPVVSQQCYDLAGVQLQIDVGEGSDMPEPLADALQFDQRRLRSFLT